MSSNEQSKPAAAPSPARVGSKPNLEMSEKALNLVLQFEGFDEGGWPGGASGITIGYGYDLGYHTLGQFGADWRLRLSVNDFQILRALVGITGTRARDRARSARGVTIKRDDARAVFATSSIPRAIAATLEAFPGAEKLPADAAGALISLVFNRGGRMNDRDERLQERREMRAIRDVVGAFSAGARAESEALMEIAMQLRSMTRLWEGANLGGLIRRREAEAALVESCITGVGAPAKSNAARSS